MFKQHKVTHAVPFNKQINNDWITSVYCESHFGKHLSNNNNNNNNTSVNKHC